jgi:hypothetical protein
MERESLEGIAAADAHLGRTVPLPALPLPLVRWVEVVTAGPDAVQVEWNLDATRPGSPGRLTLFVGVSAPPDRGLSGPETLGRYEHRTAPLQDADPDLRPVSELRWQHDDLHFRLTGQGPWELVELMALAESID